jgi:hypothetical protein
MLMSIVNVSFSSWIWVTSVMAGNEKTARRRLVVKRSADQMPSSFFAAS